MFKKGYEFGFAWMFTILVGAVIIFLGIYIAVKFVDINKVQQSTQTAKQIGVLLSPVETNLEQAKFASLTLQEETRLYNICDPEKTIFGSQDLSAQVKSRIGEEWTEFPGFASSFHNKYLFSDGVSVDEPKNAIYSQAEKNYYVLSKPFYFPFKIADLIILWSDSEKYCLVINSATVNAPQAKIREEFRDLKISEGEHPIIPVVSSVSSCPVETTKTICFSGDCDIVISTAQKKVTHKNKGFVYYIESQDDEYSLLYAAIFSDPDVYDCQIERLARRATEIAILNKQKSEYLSARGDCNSAPALSNALELYRQAFYISSSSQLNTVEDESENLRRANAALICRLF